MGKDQVSESGQEFKGAERECLVFGVERGGSLVGLGVLLLLFAIIPVFIMKVPLPVPIVLLFTGFGIFLMWAGITK